ncbi:MAG: hypothetical protein K2J37_08195 [Ruminococcus sp.]|nr:hypothetical protein [Ruminococcus sp.]MDE6784189.1 hypothetical protein [Ruminococcus sp.]
MSEKNRKTPPEIFPDNKFMSFARIFIAVIMLIFMGILTMTSMLQTTGMEIVSLEQAKDTFLYRIRDGLEIVVFYSDSFVWNLICLVLFAVICWLIMPALKKIPLWTELLFVALWTITLGAVWVYSSHSMPTEDSGIVVSAANAFARNDFGVLNPESRYFRNYSFQLGYVFFTEIAIRIRMLFGEPHNVLYLEMINAVFLAAAYVGIILINSRIFKDQRVRHITAFMMLFAAQPIIFCTFTYGIIIGIAFAIYAVLFMILYFQKDNFIYGILSAVSLAVSVAVKSNNNIVFVAVAGVIFVMMFRRKRFIKDIIYLALTCTLALSIMPVIKSSYEKRSGEDLGEPIPYTAWFVLGLNEAYNGPGWYNAYHTVDLYSNAGFDPNAAHEEAVKRIGERVKYFMENKQYTNEFFYKKFLSQWNETTYQSIWNNIVRANYEPRSGIAEWVCDKHQSGVKSYMDLYAQLIFAACFAGLIACLKNRNFLSIIFPLIILGGMLYHLLAEAKSQYSMSYFILMIGFAGYGICVSYDYFAEKSKGNRLLKLLFRYSETSGIPADSSENGTTDQITDESENGNAETEIPETTKISEN